MGEKLRTDEAWAEKMIKRLLCSMCREVKPLNDYVRCKECEKEHKKWRKRVEKGVNHVVYKFPGNP